MAVFHPDHDELHGMTVVVYSSTPRTYVGRWDKKDAGYVRLVDANYHEEGEGDLSRDQFLKTQRTYGVAVKYPFLTVPEGEVTDVVNLREVKLESS